ncbi:hypothetical protein DF107_02615 [Burkholderia stagnalis]|nr:hypothetical protein DF161_00575 [Burkholderia stagnalis]RQY84949.1 hypothetical protein DF107_02615 [Burkholderia stagnalis]
MLFGGLVPADALSIFLYRDYSFRGESPSGNDLIEIFRDEFGFRESIADENAQYKRLFDESGSSHRANPFINV